MVPSFGAARISCVLLYNGSASALWCLSRRARRDYRLGEELCQRGVASLNTGGSSGGDAGPRGCHGCRSWSHSAPGPPISERGAESYNLCHEQYVQGKRLVRKKPPAHRVNQKPPGASDADATRAYLAGENQIRCATSGIRRTALRVSADPASALHEALPAQVQGPAPQPRPARTAWPDARLRALAALPAQASLRRNEP